MVRMAQPCSRSCGITPGSKAPVTATGAGGLRSRLGLTRGRGLWTVGIAASSVKRLRLPGAGLLTQRRPQFVSSAANIRTPFRHVNVFVEISFVVHIDHEQVF